MEWLRSKVSSWTQKLELCNNSTERFYRNSHVIKGVVTQTKQVGVLALCRLCTMVPFHLPHSTDLFSVLMKEVSSLETRRSFCLIAAKRIFLRQKHTTKVMSRQQCCCLEGKRWLLILLIDRCQSPLAQPWVLLNLKYRRFQDPLLR